MRPTAMRAVFLAPATAVALLLIIAPATPARADVLNPWTEAATQTLRIHVTHARAWTGRISTPLDGSLAVTTTTGGVDLQLRSADGKNVLVRGSWGSSGGKSIGYQVCGERSFVLRVASAGPRRLKLRVTEP